MAITWKITGFEVAPTENGNTNVVKKVSWWCENQTSTGTVWMKGTTPLEASASSFTSFSSLTSSQVLGWLDDLWIAEGAAKSTGWKDYKEQIEAYVSNSANSTAEVVYKYVPW